MKTNFGKTRRTICSAGLSLVMVMTAMAFGGGCREKPRLTKARATPQSGELVRLKSQSYQLHIRIGTSTTQSP